MIIFEKVSFSYARKKVLEGFSIKIGDGEHVCLYGPSGCGKSTVLRLIMGLEKPDSGKITVNAEKIRPVFQEDRLLPFLTVSQNAAMFSGGEDPEPILHAIGLSEAEKEYPAHLSGGMARRTAIARALCGEGDLYLFDEPFNGLDEENREKAADLILRKTAGKTLVCVLHDLRDAERLHCRIVNINQLSQI